MNRQKRFKQDLIILLMLVIVCLVLWRLYVGRNRYGGMGNWVGTNIFGATTLSMFHGPGESTREQSPPPQTNETLTPITTNAAAVITPPQPRTNLPAGNAPALSSNLVNTNGLVTVVEIPSSLLAEAPPGVTVSTNVSEAATIEERLGEASAKGGDIQISLYWNNYNDLDLHCIEPSGEHIFFQHAVSARTGGELDVDRNARPPYTPTPVENIYWPIGRAPSGNFKIFVVFYAPRENLDPHVPTAFTVRVVVRGWDTFYFRSTIAVESLQVPKLVCTLQYDPSNSDPAQRFRFVR